MRGEGATRGVLTSTTYSTNIVFLENKKKKKPSERELGLPDFGTL